MSCVEVLTLYVGVLVSLLTLLSSVEGKHISLPRGKGCPQGCTTCSPYNGCVTCKPQYFLLLYRNGMKHLGVCTHACPTSYYPSRGADISRCLKCRVENCDECFTRSFCTKCAPGTYSHRGKCYEYCPAGMYPEPKTGDCKPTTNCEVAEWTEWGPCMRDGETCGRKWGEMTRTRDVVTVPSKDGLPCPLLLESQKCRVTPRFCPDSSEDSNETSDPGDRKRKKKKNKQRRRKRKRKGQKTRTSSLVGTDSDDGGKIQPVASEQNQNTRSRERTRDRTISTLHSGLE